MCVSILKSGLQIWASTMKCHGLCRMNKHFWCVCVVFVCLGNCDFCSVCVCACCTCAMCVGVLYAIRNLLVVNFLKEHWTLYNNYCEEPDSVPTSGHGWARQFAKVHHCMC
jgi:hypothetical protein